MMGTATEQSLRRILAELESDTLPTNAATETTLASCLTALQLIDDLRNALDSVGTDELDVNVEESALPTGAATEAKQDDIITAIEALSMGGFYDAYVCVRDKKPQNTPGGTFTSGDWRIRDINDEQADPQSICSIASNQITLAAGTYRCRISCPANKVGEHQAQLYNVTDSVTLLEGTTQNLATDHYVSTCSLILGRFTLADEKVLEARHRCSNTVATWGFGSQVNQLNEIYTVAEFWREA